MRVARAVLCSLSTALISCGGPAEPAQRPVTDPAPVAEVEEPAAAPEAEAPPVDAEAAKPAAVEPEFTDGMSVDEAIAAVPQGADRVNIEREALARPISDMKLYDPCKAKPNEHAKMRVAVWNGRAVGIDVSVTPKNAKLADCVKEQIRSVSWRDKEKSLNTVEFAF